MSNVACRIFKEQIDLLLSLPSQEEAKTVLYNAVINSLNQFENHFDNQIENQNEKAYVSVSESLSELSKSILNLLSKNIVWKEFSNNYGGKREGAGAPKKQKNQIEQTETETIINKFKNNIKLNSSQFRIDYNFSIKSIPDYEIYLKEVGETVLLDVQSWLIEKKQGEVVDKEFICRQIINFAKRRGIL